MNFEDLVDDSTFFLLGTRGRSLGGSEPAESPVEPWLRTPAMGWDERRGKETWEHSWGMKVLRNVHVYEFD